MKHSFSMCRYWLLLLVLTGLTGPVAWAQVPAWQSAIGLPNGGGFSEIAAVVAGTGDDVFIAGRFSGIISFGATSLTSSAGGGLFVAKWNSASRTFSWAQQLPRAQTGNGYDNTPFLAVRGSAVYVAGSFENTITFANTTLTSAGDRDIFVAKLLDAGSTGTPTWIQQAGGSGFDIATGLAVAHTGVYVTGGYDTAGATFGATALPASGAGEGFVAKLADAGPTGSFAWAQRLGGSGRASVNALAANIYGVFLAGAFAGTADFGATTLTSLGSNDAYVAKLTDTGTGGSFAWAYRMGSASYDAATALAIEGPNVYLSGNYAGSSADIGSFTLTNPNTNQVVFLTKILDQGAVGSFVWAQQNGGTGSPAATALAARGDNIYLVGYFSGNTVSFGSTTLTQSPGMPPYADAFLAKLTQTGNTAAFTWAKKVGDFGTERGTGVAISGQRVCLVGFFNSPSIDFDNINIATGSFLSYGFIATLGDNAITPPLANKLAQSEWQVSLAPNPARAAATLTLPAVPGSLTASLTLHDALGRAVRTATVPLGRHHELDLTGLPAGLYVVRVQAGTSTAMRQLLVE